MAVLIGHASIDENGKAVGGKAGDQTKKEVCTRNWYSHPWHTVIRPKDSKIAEKIAKCSEQICANDNIGYDQSQRTTLYTQAKAKNWDCSKITTKCETDCSATVAVCVNAAGITVSKDMYTGNEKSLLKATGKFTILTDTKYTKSSDYLKRGDILLANGHTAIVLSDGPKATTTSSNTTTTSSSIKKVEATQKKNTSYSGTYKTNSVAYLRTGAGKEKTSLVKLPAGVTGIQNYGYYNLSKTNKTWLYVQLTYKNKSYTGYLYKKKLTKTK